MPQLLEKHNIEVTHELQNPVDSSEHCHSVQFQGDIMYYLSAIVQYFYHVSNKDLVFDISKYKISYPFFYSCWSRIGAQRRSSCVRKEGKLHA